MVYHMAVEEPVADGVRRPPHGHRRAARHELGDDGPTRAFSKKCIADRVATGKDMVVEAVQMQGMRAPRRVDEAPLHGVPDRVRQALGVRPREAVEHQHLLAMLDRCSEGCLIASPLPEHEHTVLRRSRSADSVDDDGTAQLTVGELSEGEGVPRSPR
jgi:hypothetical protein